MGGSGGDKPFRFGVPALQGVDPSLKLLNAVLALHSDYALGIDGSRVSRYSVRVSLHLLGEDTKADVKRLDDVVSILL